MNKIYMRNNEGSRNKMRTSTLCRTMNRFIINIDITYSFRRLATKGEVNGIRTIDGIVPGIGFIAAAKELILDLIGMPRATLGIGLTELAFIASTRRTGLAFRAGERVERRRLGPIEIIVGVIRLPTV